MDELEKFCEDLYGDREGYVYSPLRDPNKTSIDDGFWTQRWFKWPVQKESLYTHIRQSSDTYDVYIAPALFSRKKVSYDTVAGSHYVWVDFDGEIPQRLGDVPTPSLKIQSSEIGHQHWYWRLDTYITDPQLIALISKKLAYALRADPSGWDPTQVLRPPTTLHHSSGKIVSRISSNDDHHSIEDFAVIEEPAVEHISLQEKDLPNVNWVVALYKWEPDAFDLFMKPELPAGTRSSGLTRLAFDCAEMGMSNEEIISVLVHADDRWKKFSNRTDRIKRLIGIVQHVRSKKSTDEILELIDRPQIYRYNEFMESSTNLDWIIDGVLPVAGQSVIFGPAGCGKTTIILRMCLAVAKGEKKYLKWDINSQRRVAFISAEMPHDELKQYFQDMGLQQDEPKLNDNFFIYPIGHAFPLNNKDNRETLLRFLDDRKIEVVILDSLSVVAGGSTTDDDVILRLNDWVNKEIRTNRRVAVFHIHHSRKAGSEDINKRMDDLNKLYGSVYIGTNAITVIGMNKIKGNTSKVEIHYVKGRYTKDAHVALYSTDNRDFTLRDVEGSEENSNGISNGREGTDSISPELFRFSPSSG